jgi:excisionase family DNA binding protein
VRRTDLLLCIPHDGDRAHTADGGTSMSSRNGANRSLVAGSSRLPSPGKFRVVGDEDSASDSNALERLTYSIDEVAHALGISRSTAYECVRRGEIPAVRFGRRVLVVRTVLAGLLSQPLDPEVNGRP